MANYCKYCGGLLEEGSSFCGRCGRPVQAIRPQPSRRQNPHREDREEQRPRAPQQKRQNVKTGQGQRVGEFQEQSFGVSMEKRVDRRSVQKEQGTPRILIPLAVAFSVLAVVLVGSLVLFLVAKNSKVDTSSPEGVIGSFLDQIGDGEMEGALSCFSSEEAAEGFDYIRYVKVYDSEDADTLLPVEDQSVQILNQRKLEGKAAREISSTLRVLGIGEKAGELSAEGVSPWKKLGVSGKSYKEKVNTDNFKEMSVKRVELAAQKRQNQDEAQKKLERQAKVYGAEERREYVALYTVGETSYIQGFTVDRYGDDWKIRSLTSELAGTSAYGIPSVAEKTSEFDNYIK